MNDNILISNIPINDLKIIIKTLDESYPLSRRFYNELCKASLKAISNKERRIDAEVYFSIPKLTIDEINFSIAECLVRRDVFDLIGGVSELSGSFFHDLAAILFSKKNNFKKLN